MDRDGRPGWLSATGFAFLSFSCGMAIFRSIHDPYAVAFVIVAYLALITLFRCLHLLERDARDRRRGRGLKVAVWSLATLLTFMFSYKVAAVMPIWGQALVWAMATLTTAAGFYAFFIARQEEP